MENEQTAPPGADPSISPVVPSQANVENPPTGQQEGGSSVSAEPAPEQTPAPEPTLEETLAAQAAAQSQTEPQVVPEQRPQAATQPADSQRSAMDKALTPAAAHGEAEYKAAEPTDVNEANALEAGRVPILLVGQRVQLSGDDLTNKVDQSGRMALIQQRIFKDPVQEMIAGMGGPESRFAEVQSYVVLTRDGRSDTLVMPPEGVSSLETGNGWGRGTI